MSDDLIRAARDGDVASARRALDAGADPSARSGFVDSTAVQWCISDRATNSVAYFTPEREAVMRLLLERGADLAATSTDGWRALTLAAVGGNLHALDVLFEHGDRFANPHDWKALHFAIAYRHPETARVLIERGADPDLRDAEGRTALMRACSLSSAEGVAMLLELGADPNAAGPDGWTALMFAATKANADNARALLEHGADPTARNADGETALDVAETKKKTKVAEALRAAPPVTR
jgi:ankyrin repeat protein